MEGDTEPETEEFFYGVYLLYCVNPKYIGRTYIGFTVDPNKRIKQHNRGKSYGGAWRTSNRGPWKMVLIVHGFPNDIVALRFEWAWAHPDTSRRLKHVPPMKRFEKTFDFNLRILSEMLIIGPWNQLPLTIRWLEKDFARDFPVNKTPPIHMPICYGPVVSKKLKKIPDSETFLNQNENISCFICQKLIESKKGLKCLYPDCTMICHITCLSKRFLHEGEYIPVSGCCPKCNQYLLWGDLVRKYRGCYDTDAYPNRAVNLLVVFNLGMSNPSVTS